MPFKSVEDELHRFKRGELHSGKGGPVVTSRKQAIAIALSEQRRHPSLGTKVKVTPPKHPRR